MLSSRGAITTSVAMVECASGQHQGSGSREIFLLSELEQAWVSLAVVARRRLLEGRNVRIPHFGSFWTEERVVAHDNRGDKYYARKLFFGVDEKFSLRYGMVTAQIPFPPRKLAYSKVSVAEMVEVCGVPARTLSAALKEFALYVGEGVFRGRLFMLSLPGVADVLLKRERISLTASWELVCDLYKVDARAWPPEVRAAGAATLEESVARRAARSSDTSLASSRPVSATSQVSWRQTPRAESPRRNFVPVAPAGRLFSEIEKETARRRECERQQALMEAQTQAQRLREEGRSHTRYIDCAVCYHEDDDDAGASTGRYTDDVSLQDAIDGYRAPPLRPAQCSGYSRPVTGESVYSLIAAARHGRSAGDANTGSSSTGSGSSSSSSTGTRAGGGDAHEPEIEVVEVSEVPPTAGARTAPARDEELARVLRAEEPFSRPLSRQQPSCSVRSLIYGPKSPGAEPGSEEVAETESPSAPHYGRKRFTTYDEQKDHVGALLRYDE